MNNIITNIGTLFAIAVAVKTLFFNGNKEGENSIYINGTGNNVKIATVNKEFNTTNNFNKYTIPQKVGNDKNKCTVSENDVLLKFGGVFICVIITIVFILVLNIYIVSVLSVLITVSMLINIKRIKKYQLSSEETKLVVIEYVILSVMVYSMLYISTPIGNLLEQIKPINLKGLSFFLEWLTESGILISHSFQRDMILSIGIVVIMRLAATIILVYTVFCQFLEKTFCGKIKKFRNNKKKFYILQMAYYAYVFFFLHSSLVYYPIKEILTPQIKNIVEPIKIWISK